MMKALVVRALVGMVALAPVSLLAQEPVTQPNWHAKTLGEALLYMVLFAGVGMALSIIGYKLFDRFTPGDLHKEILEHRNVAAALLGAAVILGTCILVAAAMMS
jgi:putative membrane protein